MKVSFTIAVLVFSFAALALSSGPPPDPPRLNPTNLGVNTPADEDDPHVTSNGKTLYYSCNTKDKFDILVSNWSPRDKGWGPGKLPDDYVRTEGDDRSVFVTRDGKFPQFLYYASRKDKETKNYDLYVAVRQGADKVFSEPTPVQALDSEADEMHPWMSADGKQLYFSRKTREGWRVWVASRRSALGPQGFDKPKVIGELPAGFHHATLTPDGRTMYLQGKLPDGRWGLFTSVLKAEKWGEPEPLEGINHPDAPTGDKSPNLSRDGATLYFASDRPNGKGGFDIWSIPTSQLAKK